jgi:preprotein translocase subunit SecD
MMANKASRYGRTLIVFVLATLAMYGGLALNGDWKPKLGLDLQGGTRITLEASTETGEEITPEKLEEAAGIIDSRVNAYGVAESEVATQGDRNIVVEIPGLNNDDIVDSVKQTAQLRFRLVAGSAPGEPAAEPTPAPSESADGGEGEQSGKGDQRDKGGKGKQQAEPSPSPAGRALSEGLVRADETPKPKKNQQPSDQPSLEVPTDPTQPTQPSTEVPTNKSSIQELLAWSDSPDPASMRTFSEFNCEDAGDVADNPAKPLVACDEEGIKYLLSPAMIEGTQLSDASFGIPQNDVQYVVNLDFNGEATDVFAEVTRAISGTQKQFAIVLDEVVLSAPVVTTPITDGNAQISGDFTAATSESLANSLKYGALPLQFEVPEVTEEGPTLAADQLDAGIWAGGIGLALVVVYSMLYYRGLGIVVVSSLAMAAALTYAVILFLSEQAGFTLTLPGIAGLIVGVGVTADSFIVLFERIRDEMRDGKSVRVAVEAGWSRAVMTCVIADAVALLAAVVLFIFAIGVVKGFAFALGITTVIDLVVFFFFTKPLVSWLAQFKFFSSGHKLSGFSAEQAGIDRIGARRPAGVMAR